MTDVALPPARRPESSRQAAVEIVPRRPDSSRARPGSSGNGKRRSPSRQQKDLVNPVHGSNDPAPVAGAVASGPGQFRNYASDTRYLESDPLRHGLDTKQVASTPFAMGPKSCANQSSQTSSFRTLDISRANEGRQNWTRIDTFLTPSGHAHDDDFGRSPRKRPASRSRNEASAKSLAQDVFITDLSEKFAELRQQIQEDTLRLLQPMQQDIDTEISKTKEIVQTVRSDNLKTVEEIRRLRSMEQHKQMLQAYPTPIDKEVFETELKRLTDVIQALSGVVTSVQEDVSALKEGDFFSPSRTVSFRRGKSPPDTSHLGISHIGTSHGGSSSANFEQILDAIRAVLSEMDFSPMLEEIKREIPATEFRAALAMVQEQMSEVIIHLRTVQNEVQNRHAEVDFAPVLDALASSPLHESISEVRSSLEQTKAEMASNTQQLFALWSQLPPIDFAPIFDCIASNRVELDLSPVLAAIQEMGVKENMRCQFGEILDEINHRQSHLDFSELLESLKTTKMKVDFNGVIAEINDSSEQVSNLITEMKSSLCSSEQSETMLERIQELQQVQDKSVLSGIAGLKDWTERLAQKFSILLQTMNEKDEQEVKVNFTPVLEAIERNKVHIDFSPILTSIKKNCDFSELTEDVGRVLKTLQDMKVQVDFTPVLRAVRECKQETVFELLSAFRDQCTDTGELNDNLVKLRESTQANLIELKEGLEKESKEALTSEVLRAFREKDVRIDLEIKKALDHSNELAEKGASNVQDELRSLRDSILHTLRESETRCTAESQNLQKVVQAIEVRPQVKIDLAPVSKMVEELHLKVDHLDEVHDRLVHTVEEQAQGQDHLHEVVGEVSEATQRQSEALKTILREKIDNVIQRLQDDDAKMELSKEQLNQTRTLTQALQQRPTTEELDHRLASVLQALQDELRQMQAHQQGMFIPPADFKREISDAMEAASADQIDRNSLEVLLREQMQRHKKDLQSALEDQHNKDRRELATQHQTFLSQLQGESQELQGREMLQTMKDQLDSSFAQVLSEIRSQQSSIDLAPLMTSLRDTQEMTQGVSSAVRSLRAAGASIGAGEIGPNSTAEISPENWEWLSQSLSRTVGDQFSHQLQQLQLDQLLLDMSQMTRNLHQERSNFQAILREVQDQLQRGPSELQNPSSPSNDLISTRGSLNQISSPLERDSREILAAIRELQRNLDLSHEFSAVLAAIQEKDVKHTPVLVALQEQKTDINAQLDDLKELVRQGERPRSSASSRRQTIKADRLESPGADSPDHKGLARILDAIREQKVSIDFSVVQVLNNIQQKQQETIDKLILTDQQLDLLKQGLSKLNGQDIISGGRFRSAPTAGPGSPRNLPQWALPGSPWIPPGILGLDK